jgi:hypothetical protein
VADVSFLHNVRHGAHRLLDRHLAIDSVPHLKSLVAPAQRHGGFVTARMPPWMGVPHLAVNCATLRGA